MSGPARVLDIDALEAFRVAYVRFRSDAAKALGAVESDLQRILEHLADKQKFWTRTVRECQEEVARCKSDLARRQMGYERGRGPGCTEQEEALEEAKRRLAYAEDKVEKCRHWNRALPHAVLEYQGPARQLSGMLDTEVRHSIALLQQKVMSLEQYLAVESGASSAAEGPAAGSPPSGSQPPA